MAEDTGVLAEILCGSLVSLDPVCKTRGLQ